MNRADVVIGSIGLMLGVASFLYMPLIFADCTSTVSQIDMVIPYDLTEQCSMLDSIELTTKILGIDAVGMIQLGTMISILISLVILAYGAVVTTEAPQMKKYVLVSKPKTKSKKPFYSSTTPRISYSKED